MEKEFGSVLDVCGVGTEDGRDAEKKNSPLT